MLPAGCPDWEYKDHPKRKKLLTKRQREILTALLAGTFDIHGITDDSRPVHRDLFEGLTPPKHGYYAGNYRGSNFHCLLQYEICIQGDPKVGVKASSVATAMQLFSAELRRAIERLDIQLVKLGVLISPAYRMAITAQLVCHAFVSYLTIHPFANGNGHVARVLMFSVLSRFNYYPEHWSIEPQPQFQNLDYGQLIFEFRRGNRTPFETFLVTCLSVGRAAPAST